MYKWPAFFIGFAFVIIFGAAFSGAIGLGHVTKQNLSEASISEKIQEKHFPLPDKKSLISSEVVAGEAVTEKSVDKIVSKLIDNNYVKKIDKKNMKLDGAAKRKEITSASYSQTFKGLPVYGSKSIFVFKGNVLKLAESNFFEKINIDAKPKLSAEDAAKKISDSEKIHGKPELMVYPKQEKKGTQFYLAYKVDAPLDKDMKAMTYFVDARSGAVIDKFNRAVNDNTVRGKIYPYNPKNGSIAAGIPHEYVSAESGRNNVFRSDGDQNGYAVLHTKNNFDLSGTDYAEVSILFKGDVIAPDSIEINSYNYGFPSYSGSYHASPNSPELGKISTRFPYLWGNTSFRIDYSTYGTAQLRSVEIDNINITAYYSNGTTKALLFDSADSGFSNFDNIGFYVANEPAVSKILATNAAGVYTGLSAGENISATLSGPYFDLYNFGKADSKYFSSQNFDLDWTSADNSYKNEETNAFFHLNYAHDFFDYFSLAPDEKILANLQFNFIECNAFAVYPNELYFAGSVGGCESTALGSDIIYHEYTHLITAPLLQSASWSSNQAGAMGEGLSDYFAATITNDPAIGENILNAADVRYLNNSLVYPNDFAGGVDCAPTDENDNCFSHDNSRIFSGALWDLRNNIGSSAANDLVTGAILTSYSFYDFSDFLNRMAGYDYLYYDGLYKSDICGAFESHGISSTSCEKVHVFPIGPEPEPANNNKGWMTVNLTSDYVLVDCKISAEKTNIQADYLDDYTWTANITGFDEGYHSYFANCQTADGSISSYPRQFKFDYTPPYVEFSYPQNNSFVNPEFSLGFPDHRNIGTDEFGIPISILFYNITFGRNSWFFIFDDALQPSDTNFNIDSFKMRDGNETAAGTFYTGSSFADFLPESSYFLNDKTYNFSLGLKDRAGNPAKENFTFNIDKLAPKFNMSVDKIIVVPDRSPLKISLNASDKNFNFTTITFKGNKVGEVVPLIKDSATDYIWNASGFDYGSYLIFATAYDKAENMMTAYTPVYVLPSWPDSAGAGQYFAAENKIFSPVDINFTGNSSVAVKIMPKYDYYGSGIFVSSFSNNPLNETAGLTSAKKFVDVSGPADGTFRWVNIGVNYSNSEAADMDTGSLKFYSFNRTAGAWQQENGWIDESAKTLWINSTHLSLFAVGWNNLTPPTTTTTTTTTLPPTTTSTTTTTTTPPASTTTTTPPTTTSTTTTTTSSTTTTTLPPTTTTTVPTTTSSTTTSSTTTTTLPETTTTTVPPTTTSTTTTTLPPPTTTTSSTTTTTLPSTTSTTLPPTSTTTSTTTTSTTTTTIPPIAHEETFSFPNWFKTDFSHRKKIEISNSGAPLKNYPVFLNLPFNEKMQNDFSDIRFTWNNSTANVEIDVPYWIESAKEGIWSHVWVNIPEISSEGEILYVYYGNKSSVVSESNGYKVFPFFDDFENSDSIDSNKWFVKTGDWIIQNGDLIFNKDHSLGIIATKQKMENYSTKISAKYNGSARVASSAIGIRYDNSTSMENSYSAISSIANSQSFQCDFGHVNLVDNNTMMEFTSFKKYCYSNSTYHTFELGAYGNKMEYKADGENKFNFYDSTLKDGYSYILAQYAADADSKSSRFSVDWILQRPLSDTEPTVLFGKEETAPEDIKISNLNVKIGFRNGSGGEVKFLDETADTQAFFVGSTKIRGLKVYSIEISDELKSEFLWATLRFNYSGLAIDNINEDSLAVYFFNETQNSWVKEFTTLNKTGKYAEANVSHFSTFALGGDENVAVTTTAPPSGGGGSSSGWIRYANPENTTNSSTTTATTIFEADKIKTDSESAKTTISEDERTPISKDDENSGPTGLFSFIQSQPAFAGIIILVLGGALLFFRKKLNINEWL